MLHWFSFFKGKVSVLYVAVLFLQRQGQCPVCCIGVLSSKARSVSCMLHWCSFFKGKVSVLNVALVLFLRRQGQCPVCCIGSLSSKKGLGTRIACWMLTVYYASRPPKLTSTKLKVLSEILCRNSINNYVHALHVYATKNSLHKVKLT